MAQLSGGDIAEAGQDLEFKDFTLPDFKPSFMPVSELEERVNKVRCADAEQN